MKKLSKKDRQQHLQQKIHETPFITDEELAKNFNVSIQTIRLDRMALGIPELRRRIKEVADKQFDRVKALPIDEVIGDIIDLQLDEQAISIFQVGSEHVFSRNNIARGHHLFAQANSLAVAVINDALALTEKAQIRFTAQVKEGESVVAKAVVTEVTKWRTTVNVVSRVGDRPIFKGVFTMYRANDDNRKDRHDETST